jgi:ribosomal-protein-serine acetyltransferase
MFAALEIDRPSFLPWLPWVGIDNRSVAECTYQIERFRRNRNLHPLPEVVLGIFDRTSGEVVGGTGLHDIHPAPAQAEVGYWIRADLRNRGLCTEAVGGLVEWCLAPPADGGWGLRRLEIRCAASNVASARVPRKLGLVEEARLRQHRWVDGVGWDDTLVFGVISGSD